jgi:hypothetical protein
MMTDDQGAVSEEDDDDDASPVPGRSYDDDCRIAVHETGHVIAALLLGEPVGFVTVNPADGYEGCVRGEWGIRAFIKEGGKAVDARELRKVLAPAMPQPGEDRAQVSDVFSSVHAKCIEYAADKVAEKMLLDGEPSSAADDQRQARELAALICSSEKAVDSFLNYCEIAAHDLLSPHAMLIWSFSIVLRIRRIMTRVEVSDAVASILASLELAAERARRRDWKQRLENAKSFQCGMTIDINEGLTWSLSEAKLTSAG